MSYADEAAQLGGRADGELAGAYGSATLAQSQLAVAQAEIDRLTAEAVEKDAAIVRLEDTVAADQVTIGDQAARLQRKTERIASLRAQLEAQPVPFS